MLNYMIRCVLLLKCYQQNINKDGLIGQVPRTIVEHLDCMTIHESVIQIYNSQPWVAQGLQQRHQYFCGRNQLIVSEGGVALADLVTMYIR